MAKAVVKMDTLIGSFVLLSTDEGNYKGHIYSVDMSRDKVSLEGVTIHPSGKHLGGLQHFYTKEITSVDILEKDEAVIARKTEKSLQDEPGRRILHHNKQPTHLDRMKNDINRDILLNKVPYKATTEEKAADSVPWHPNSCNYFHRNRHLPHNMKRPRKFFVLDEIDDYFYKAITHIQTESIVGIGLEGVKIGRNGILCWLNVASQDFVFLFDILKLGETCFQQGMKEVLQHPDILKVLHDSRAPSDCLHHQYAVSLVNVFDTQVADVMVMQQEQMGTFPRYVQALAPCLMRYLPLENDQVYFPRMRLGHEKEDLGIWKQRPLPDHLQQAAANNVMYLRELRVTLMEAMLSQFTHGVDHYLSVIRDTSDVDAAMKRDNLHLLPAEFEYIGSSRKKKGVEQKSQGMKDEHGFCEVSQERFDPYVIYSRDVWHISQD